MLNVLEDKLYNANVELRTEILPLFIHFPNQFLKLTINTYIDFDNYFKSHNLSCSL